MARDPTPGVDSSVQSSRSEKSTSGNGSETGARRDGLPRRGPALREPPAVRKADLFVAQPSAAQQTYRVEDQIGFLLRRAHQRATSLFQSLIGDADITPTQYSSLVKLLEHSELSQNLLGRLVAMDKATTQGVVRRLKSRHLVASRPDPGDARRTLLRLTPAGRKLIEGLIANGPRVSEQTLEPLAADERQTLVELLRRLG